MDLDSLKTQAVEPLPDVVANTVISAVPTTVEGASINFSTLRDFITTNVGELSTLDTFQTDFAGIVNEETTEVVREEPIHQTDLSALLQSVGSCEVEVRIS